MNFFPSLNHGGRFVRLIAQGLLLAGLMNAGALPLAGDELPQVALNLKGTQTLQTMILPRARGAHQVTGIYVVPAGTTLIIQAGAKLEFASKTGLTVEGTLLVQGTELAPVVLLGKASGTGYWKGITLNKSTNSAVHHARIKGAETGLHVLESDPTIVSSIFARNRVGLQLLKCAAKLSNCLITENEEDGIFVNAATPTIDRCTIYRNGGWGVRGEYYASPVIAWSTISENRGGGLWCRLYTCRVKANQSIILKNKNCDVLNESSETWDLSGNWWGSAATQLLKKKGDTADLWMIKDNRDSDGRDRGGVNLSAFLETEPEQCGSSLLLRVHWKDLK